MNSYENLNLTVSFPCLFEKHTENFPFYFCSSVKFVIREMKFRGYYFNALAAVGTDFLRL